MLPTTGASLPVVGAAAQLVNKWRITSTTKLGYRRNDLKLQACNAAKLAPGDFVQAHVKFIVVTRDSRSDEPPKVFVHLDLISVVRLVAARHVPEVRHRSSTLPKTTLTIRQIMPTYSQSMAEDNALGATINPGFEENLDEGPDMV